MSDCLSYGTSFVDRLGGAVSVKIQLLLKVKLPSCNQTEEPWKDSLPHMTSACGTCNLPQK
jgi:hypothetical protein